MNQKHEDQQEFLINQIFLFKKRKKKKKRDVREYLDKFGILESCIIKTEICFYNHKCRLVISQNNLGVTHLLYQALFICGN